MHRSRRRKSIRTWRIPSSKKHIKNFISKFMSERITLISGCWGRIECTYCSCWFSQNHSLFPDVTRERIRIALNNIHDENWLNNYLLKLWAHLKRSGNDINFPEWLCHSVRSLLKRKIEQLWIEIDEFLWLGYSSWNWKNEAEAHHTTWC